MATEISEETGTQLGNWLSIPTLHFIDGSFVASQEGKTFQTFNPASGEILSEVSMGGRVEVDQAVQAAQRALTQGPWGKMTARERAVYLRRIADLIESDWHEKLALVESLDVGKPIRETTHGLIPRAAANFRFFAELAEHLESRAYTNLREYMFYVLREPVGVCGLITPWNFPLMLSTWKVGPCLAAGNTCILKPAELTPIAARQIAEIVQEADLPPGVFNVVQGFGPDSAGQAVVEHELVNAISFTGETATGKDIMQRSASNLKRLSFELGGKGATIVFSDADMEQALSVAERSAFLNQGEVCLAGSRILVERKVFEDFTEGLVKRAKSLRVGDPLKPETEMGALISPDHLEKVLRYIELGQEQGARLLCGGERPSDLPQGNFLLPTVLVETDAKSRICQEEIFGPVVTVTPFDSEEQAIEMANGTPYGLSVSICSENLRQAHRVAAKLDFGNIWINSWFVRDLRVPFGGMKQSGIGREGGVHSLEFFSELKTVGLPV